MPLSSSIMQFERKYLIIEDEGGACLQDGRNLLSNNMCHIPDKLNPQQDRCENLSLAKG